jgi:hypothetical protein
MADTIPSAAAANSTLFLGHDGEFWDFWLIVSVVIAAMAATAIGVATAGSVISHKREAAAANRSLEEYKLHAAEQLAQAQAESENAKKGVAKANEIAAMANQRAAVLEKENLEIRTRIAGRRISEEQHRVLVEELSREPGSFVLQSMTDGESGLYASDIFKVLMDAHWTPLGNEFPMGEVWIGLIVFQTDDPAALRITLALKKAGIAFLVGDNQHKKEKATVLVGAKPAPF